MAFMDGRGADGNPLEPVDEGAELSSGRFLLGEARADGVQIYTCERDEHGHVAWVLDGPEATLSDTLGHTIHHYGGRHMGGPIWEGPDGSACQGETEHMKATDMGSNMIPWLTIPTHMYKSGALGGVHEVERFDTSGGKPLPAKESDLGTQTRVHYTAGYKFWGSMLGPRQHAHADATGAGDAPMESAAAHAAYASAAVDEADV